MDHHPVESALFTRSAALPKASINSGIFSGEVVGTGEISPDSGLIDLGDRCRRYSL
jgi:hypothetical protein